MRTLIVVTALLLIAGVQQAHAQTPRLPCSTNPGPNCYNDLAPRDKLANCERAKDAAKLGCYKLTGPKGRDCIEDANRQFAACVDAATR